MRKPEACDFQAQIGLTHHLGEMRATVELLRLAGISGGECVLEVGCGAGVTTAMLAAVPCQVYALDCSERMVARTRLRLAQAGTIHRTHIRQGEIERLPYASELFDVVLGESVTVCAQDKVRAIHEYQRVLRPGGVLALNEPTWIRAGPPVEIVEWVRAASDLSGALSAAAWASLLSNAGFDSDVITLNKTDSGAERRERIKRYRLRGLLAAFSRRVGLWLRSPDYREHARKLRAKGPPPHGLYDYLGYGIFICRRPQST